MAFKLRARARMSGRSREQRARALLLKMLLRTGSAMWSARLSSGALPVTAAWLRKPRNASMARRPLRTCTRGRTEARINLGVAAGRRSAAGEEKAHKEICRGMCLLQVLLLLFKLGPVDIKHLEDNI